MPQTKKRTLRRISKVRIPKNTARCSSGDVYDVDLDDATWGAFDQSPNDSGAATPNNTATHGFDLGPSCFDEFVYDSTWVTLTQSPNGSGTAASNNTAASDFLEPWDSNPSYFDEFIHGDVWKAYEDETVKDETECTETQKVDKSATVLTGLNMSHGLDIRNAGHVPQDSMEVSASSFSVEETSSNSGEGPGKFEWAACNPDGTDSTSENGRHQPEEQKPGNSSAEGFMGTSSGIVSNPIFREGMDDSRKGASSLGCELDENHMTPSDVQASADRPLTKRKHVTSSNSSPKRCRHVASSKQ